MPRESTIYVGDNARTPYGPRPDDEVIRFSAECLDQLASRDVKAIVVACNTSTAVALHELRRRYDLPILGVVRPGAQAAALSTRTRRVGVIATQATVRSHAYFEAIKDENPFVEVYEHATPELVPLVEAGRLTGPDVEAVVRRELAPLLGERDARGEFIFPLPAGSGIDTLLLGCTHYPLLSPIIESVAGNGIAVIDSASATAGALATLLEVEGLLAPDDIEPTHAQFTTGDIERFRATAELLFGDVFPNVEGLDVGDPVAVGPGTTGTADELPPAAVERDEVAGGVSR
jgi:glutamate racemase